MKSSQGNSRSACNFHCYIRYAQPWVPCERQKLAEGIAAISHLQCDFAGRIGRLIAARGGRTVRGVFPLRFTSLNDLSLEYLAPLFVQDERQILREIGDSLDEVQHDPEATALVKDLLNAEEAHLKGFAGRAEPKGRAAADRGLRSASRDEYSGGRL